MSDRERIVAIFLVIAIAISFAYCLLFLTDKAYKAEDFGFSDYKSASDADGDGVDDQSDILQSAIEYLATNPEYKSVYYEGGYPNDNYGVCTDVVAFALRGAGFDLMELVDKDINANPNDYSIEEGGADKNIDFRRVANLKVFFKKYAISLSTDPDDIEEWQGGDIVVWDHHVGVISSVRTRRGITYVLHNGSPNQKDYQENVLFEKGVIIGHYRIDTSLLEKLNEAVSAN